MKNRPLSYLVTYCKAKQWVVASLFGAKAFKRASKAIKVGLNTQINGVIRLKAYVRLTERVTTQSGSDYNDYWDLVIRRIRKEEASHNG